MRAARSLPLLAALALLTAGCVMSPAPALEDVPGPAGEGVEAHGVHLIATGILQTLAPGSEIRGSLAAVNEGEAASLLDCPGPWSLRLRSSAGEILALEPPRGCTADERPPVPFAPGEGVSREFRFAGGAWSEEAGAEERVPPGEYHLVVDFEFTRDGLRQAVRLEAPLTVEGPTPEEPRDPAPQPGPTRREATPDGVQLTGNLSRASLHPGESLSAFFQAYNGGADATVRGGCETPWQVQVLTENGSALLLRPPEAVCLGFRQEPFPHDATLQTEFTWNGTHYTEEAYRKAPPGNYSLEGAFRYARSDVQETIRVQLPFRIQARP